MPLPFELGAAVCSDGFRGAEAGDPGIEEGLGDCRCGDVVDGRSLGPSGEAVDHRQDVAVAVVHGQGSHYVYVDVLEPTVWNRKGLEGGFGVPVDLVSLAFDTGTTPLPNVLVDGGPDDLAAYWVARMPRCWW